IVCEIDRQIGVIDSGDKIIQATWRWNDELGITTLMRTKENADDYRYLPDPDLLPVRTANLVAKVQAILPELPHQKVARFEEDFQITHYDASVLASDGALADFYETAAKGAKSPKKAVSVALNRGRKDAPVRSVTVFLRQVWWEGGCCFFLLLWLLPVYREKGGRNR
ncbi:hypothetical protein OAE25_02595, partial [Verrucomicrobiales bacterium]|nr:hypothetical protein [Verrucomicrobiales bacterium]